MRLDRQPCDPAPKRRPHGVNALASEPVTSVALARLTSGQVARSWRCASARWHLWPQTSLAQLEFFHRLNPKERQPLGQRAEHADLLGAVRIESAIDLVLAAQPEGE